MHPRLFTVEIIQNAIAHARKMVRDPENLYPYTPGSCEFLFWVTILSWVTLKFVTQKKKCVT
jgi:hypothetical protein